MKKITKKAEFVRTFLGGQSYLKGNDFWQQYVDDKIKNALLPEKQKKKEQADPIEVYKKSLSVFNYFPNNGQNVPILGNWMLKGCWVESAYELGKTQKGNDLPGRGVIESARFEPFAIFLYRDGTIIEKLDRLDLNMFKPKGSKQGIVKLREAIEPPAGFEFTLVYNEKTISENDVKEILDHMQWHGLGSWRQKNGTFQYV